MAKGLGIFGNFKGKAGNVVGFNIKASNNKQTQGIRVYQPNVANPKTAAQAEQRVRFAPVSATYRALKAIIDRGNEYQPYGYRSRIAWLKEAYKVSTGPFFEKGVQPIAPVLCQLSFGSLPSLEYHITEDFFYILAEAVTAQHTIHTVADLTSLLMESYSFLRLSDQLTFVTMGWDDNQMQTDIYSVVLSDDDTTPVDRFIPGRVKIEYYSPIGGVALAIIVSREGANGKHLRSSDSLIILGYQLTQYPYNAASKKAAIASFMTGAGSSQDWQVEQLSQTT